MGVQKRKVSKSVSTPKRSKSTYFKQKAKSISVSKTIKRELKSQKKMRAKISKQSAKAVKSKPKLSFSQKRMTQNQQVASAISKYFLSSDMARQSSPSVAYEQKKTFESPVEISKLASSMNTGLKGRQKRERLNRIEIMRRNIMILVRRLLSWFSARSYSLNLTLSGRRALSQLEDLYDLLILEAASDEDLLKLKVAYGEACYYVTQASRGYHKKHSGRGRENYSPYFDRFVESATG